MAKRANQKLKMFYLAQIMLSRTDLEHYLTMPQIIAALKEYGVSAERKSVYDDLHELEKIGIEVAGESFGREYGYHVISRQFELAELKLLVDAIQSSKFITERKSNELIGKLETLVSNYEAKDLSRQVYVSGRIKTMNESIYYNVDEIHKAIAANRKIRFQYYQWNVKKEMELRKGGAFYLVSPWGLSWDDENYYLVGYDAEVGQIRHYRVDKMRKISLVEEPREGRGSFLKLDMAAYARKSFGMFGGKEEKVKLLVSNSLAGVIIDRFGKDISLIPAGEGRFTVNVDVQISRNFFGWVFSLGDGVQIVGPAWVKEEVQQEVRRLMAQYLPDGVTSGDEEE